MEDTLLDRVANESAIVDFFSFLLVSASDKNYLFYSYFVMLDQYIGHVQVINMASSMHDSFFFARDVHICIKLCLWCLIG